MTEMCKKKYSSSTLPLKISIAHQSILEFKNILLSNLFPFSYLSPPPPFLLLFSTYSVIVSSDYDDLFSQICLSVLLSAMNVIYRQFLTSLIGLARLLISELGLFSFDKLVSFICKECHFFFFSRKFSD